MSNVQKTESKAQALNEMSIKQAAKYMSLTEFRVRRLIHEGRLTTRMVPVKPGSKVMKHLIERKSLDEYNVSKGSRADGRVQYIVRLKPNEALALKALAKEHLDGLELQIVKRFQPKKSK